MVCGEGSYKHGGVSVVRDLVDHGLGQDEGHGSAQARHGAQQNVPPLHGRATQAEQRPAMAQ